VKRTVVDDELRMIGVFWLARRSLSLRYVGLPISFVIKVRVASLKTPPGLTGSECSSCLWSVALQQIELQLELAG